MKAKLFCGCYFEYFIHGAVTPGQGNKGAAFFLHNVFALLHGFCLDNAVSLFITPAFFYKEFRDNTYYFAAVSMHGFDQSSHKAGFAAAIHKCIIMTGQQFWIIRNIAGQNI